MASNSRYTTDLSAMLFASYFRFIYFSVRLLKLKDINFIVFVVQTSSLFSMLTLLFFYRAYFLFPFAMLPFERMCLLFVYTVCTQAKKSRVKMFYVAQGLNHAAIRRNWMKFKYNQQPTITKMQNDPMDLLLIIILYIRIFIFSQMLFLITFDIALNILIRIMTFGLAFGAFFLSFPLKLLCCRRRSFHSE